MAKIEKYKKKNGTSAWKFQVYLGMDPATGKEKRTTRQGFKTKKEAELALSRLKVEVEENGFSSNACNSYLFHEVYSLWLPVYEKSVKESTYNKTTGIFKNHILPQLGHMKIEFIKVTHCQKAVNIWSEKLKAFKLINNYTSMVFKYAINTLSILNSDPTRKITLPVIQDTINNKEKEENYYEKEELISFFDAMKQETKELNTSKWYALFRSLAYSTIN